MAKTRISKTVSLAREYFPIGEFETSPDWLSGNLNVAEFNHSRNGAFFSANEEFKIGPDFGERIGERVVPIPVGIELLAWYTSFRYQKWGIYIREVGIEMIASVLNHSLNDPALSRETAFKVLLEHELTHFRIDASIASSELLAKKSIYKDWRNKTGFWPSWSDIEEGLCNSHALDAVPAICRPDLMAWMADAPHGYNDFASHKRNPLGRDESWSRLFTEISADLDNSSVGYLRRTKAFIEFPPVFIVRDPLRPTNGVVPFSFMGALRVEESEAFMKSLKKSGDAARLARKWSKAKEQIESGIRTPGLNFEQYSQDVFTVRLNSQIRAILRVLGDGVAEVISISQQHDIINKTARLTNG